MTKLMPNGNTLREPAKEMKSAKQRLEEMTIYGRKISQFQLPDQVTFLEYEMKQYAKDVLEEASKNAKMKTLWHHYGGYDVRNGGQVIDKDSILNTKTP